MHPWKSIATINYTFSSIFRPLLGARSAADRRIFNGLKRGTETETPPPHRGPSSLSLSPLCFCPLWRRGSGFCSVGHVGYKHQRQTDNYTVRVGRSCHCVCVCVLTHPQLICSLFFTDTICLCFILSETTLFTLEISLSQQQLPALFFNPLFSFVVLHADESQKSGLPPGRELRLQKNHDAAGRCPLEGNEQLRATPVRVFCRST